MVQCMATILKSTNHVVQQEIPLATLGPFMDLASTGSGRMDLTITSGNSTPILADVTITHPIISDRSLITVSMTQPLYFAKHREEAKIRKYSGRAIQINQHFIPLVLETYGAYGPKFSQYIKSLASYAVQNRSFNQRAQLIRYWRMKISACLQRANSRLIINKAHRIRSRMRQGTQPTSLMQDPNWELR